MRSETGGERTEVGVLRPTEENNQLYPSPYPMLVAETGKRRTLPQDARLSNRTDTGDMDSLRMDPSWRCTRRKIP